jgi:uncharacterized membrane protein
MRLSLTDLHHSIEPRLPAFYLALTLLLGGLYACITPPFFAPDEAPHSMRGLQVASGTLLAQVNPAGKGDVLDSAFSSTAAYFYGLVEKNVHQANRDRVVPRIAVEQLQSERDVRWSGQPAFDSFAMTRIYPPTFYFPASIGWHISEARSYTIVHSLLLARLCNLLFAAGIGWLALLLGKGYRWSIAAILLIPALLALDGSCSQDAMIVSSAALGIAILSRPLIDKRLPWTWELVLAGVALCAVGMTRPPYMLLLVSLVLPAVELRCLTWRGLLPPIGVGLVAFVMDFSWYLAVRPLGYLVGPGAQPAAQFVFLSHNPLRGLGYVLLGLLRAIPILGSSIAEAGSGDVRPSRIIDFFVLLVVVTVLISQKTLLIQRVSSRLLVLLVCIGISVGMAFAEYIIWTSPAAKFFVDGLQIRHFLVFLPLLGLVSGFVRPPRAQLAQLCLLAIIPLDLWVLVFDAHTFYGSALFSALRMYPL